MRHGPIEIRNCEVSYSTRSDGPRLKLKAYGLKLPSGFTLVELLTVVAIIATLVGILMPAFHGVRTAAKKAKTQTLINGLAISMKAYYNEYGIYPTNVGTPLTQEARRDVLELLRGANSRSIVFFEPKASDLVVLGGNVTNIVDAWGQPLGFCFDGVGAAEDNQTEVYGDPGPLVMGPFAIWSTGADKVLDSSSLGHQKNKDNVGNWQ